MAFTPLVFCAVRAVNTVAAYTLKNVNVFISACMPAPALESEPAIKSTDFFFKFFLSLSSQFLQI